MTNSKHIDYLVEINKGIINNVIRNEGKRKYLLKRDYNKKLLACRNIGYCYEFEIFHSHFIVDENINNITFDRQLNEININLFLSFIDNYDISKKNIYIPDENGLYFNNKIEDAHLSGLERVDFINSYLALYHYLNKGVSDYINDIDFINSEIKKYLYYKKISFPSSSQVIICSGLTRNKSKDDSIEYYFQKFTNSLPDNASVFIPNMIDGFRYLDILGNYELSKFEAGEDGGYDIYNDCNIWEYPTADEITHEWNKYYKIWDETFYQIMMSLSKELDIRIVFRYDCIP
jgi:hypothetical protein